jgi:prepilin-type N-terminal cleavage/methylation domain-containing protein
VSSGERQGGYTIVELTVVMLVMSVVLVIAGSVFISLSTTANRNDSMVADEQAASSAVTQMTRDIRSANSISFPASNPGNQIQLVDNQQSGGTQTVMWSYNPAARTLTRQVLVGSSFSTSGPPTSRVANPSTSPVFTYFDDSGSNISATTVANITKCATSIGVHLYIAPSISGVATFQESDQVALTNQLDTLSAPGSNGQCAS